MVFTVVLRLYDSRYKVSLIGYSKQLSDIHSVTLTTELGSVTHSRCLHEE